MEESFGALIALLQLLDDGKIEREAEPKRQVEMGINLSEMNELRLVQIRPGLQGRNNNGRRRGPAREKWNNKSVDLQSVIVVCNL
jgi:hypothetical protein